MNRPAQSTTSASTLWGYILHLESQAKPTLTLSADVPTKNKAKGTLDECVCYAVSRQLPATDGEWFFDRMETVGWQLGKAKVKDWQACIRTWQREGYLPSLRQGYGGTVKITTQAQWEPPTGV
jgi:hypothetical protein